jgi:hypothetical protein
LKYSLPAMKASASYSKKDIERAESEFHNLNRLSNDWGTGAEVLFLVGAVSGIIGILILRFAKKKQPA